MAEINIQNTGEQDETSFRFMLKIGGPMVVATISYTLMQFVDRLMVAHYSQEALAAVLPASIISFVPSSFLLGVMTTVNTFVSQSFGRRAYRDCAHYAWQSLYLGMVYSCITFAILWPLAGRLFVLMDQPAEIVPLEVTYLRIMLIGQFVVVSIWSTNQFFMGIHQAKITMITALVSQCVNVLANYVLIFGKWGFPEMGIAGAAWGTVIGAVVNAMTRVVWFLSPSIHKTFHSRTSFRFDVPKILDLVKIGAPAGFALMVNTAFIGAILFSLIGRFGTAAQAATSAVYSCMTLSFMPVVGIGIALTATVGKSIGRNRKDIATKQTSLCLRLSMGYMGLVGLVFFLFRHAIISVWGLTPEAAILGAKIMICAAIFQVFDAAVITYNGALRGAGDTLWLGLVTTVGAFLVLGCGGWLIVVLMPQWNAIGPWVAYTLHVILVGVTNRWRFKSNHWHDIDLFKRQSTAVPVEESV
ncbi:MAG: MATE family efflux transporter [Phycisphaeraceae bacterium]|nr:MATE family efflux transporter [Phycisphaeraceae bacterium]